MKISKKGDFRKILDPFWGFTLKTVLGFRDSPHFVIALGTKNHEMRGPPVVLCLISDGICRLVVSFYVCQMDGISVHPFPHNVRQYLFSDRSKVSRSLDSAAMIAARMSFPLNPCNPKNVGLENPSRSLRPRCNILV